MICFFVAIIVFAGCKHFLYVVSFCQEVSVVFQLNMSCVHGPNTLSNSLPKSEALLYLQPPAVSYKHKQTVLQTLTDFSSFHQEQHLYSSTQFGAVSSLETFHCHVYYVKCENLLSWPETGKSWSYKSCYKRLCL